MSNLFLHSCENAAVSLLCIQTDLGAAWSAAHIRPVLLVIHVIGKPGKMQKTKTNKQTLTSPPSRAVYGSEALLKGRSCAGASFSGRPFTSLPCIFHHTDTLPPVKLLIEQVRSGHPPVTLLSSWKLCVIIAKMMDVPP